MRGRSAIIEDYDWTWAEHELGAGIHPEVVAARLGEPIAYLLKVADRNRWPIRWQHQLPSPEKTIDRFNALYGFNA